MVAAVDVSEIEDRLSRGEEAVAAGRTLQGTGFWAAVSQARWDPVLAAAYADRIAVIDRRAFEQAVRMRTSPRRGLALLAAGCLAGLAAIAAAAALDGLPQAAVLLLAWGLLTLSSHSLAHWAVGRMLGITFTHVFIGHLPEPFPGVKIDYAAYLSTPPRSRALMHAAGAVVSKIVPFAILGAALALDAQSWARTVLLVAGIVGIAMDAVGWFVTGDWKRVRRELAAARH